MWFKERVEMEKGRMYYSSMHQILLVGEGDFSFSLSLAIAFGSGVNIVATSLDTEDLVVAKYAKGGSNLKTLKKMGATLLHGIDATKMILHTDLNKRRFHRIVYNFPHAGFKRKEDDLQMINLHRNLVYGFFDNAKFLLLPSGQIHVTHKTDVPYCKWKIEELASRHSLVLVGCPKFNIEDYPGYNNKRGDGWRCDEQFTLGDCCTFMFVFGHTHERKPLEAIPNMYSSFSGGSLPDRNVHPLALRYSQNAYLSSLESFPRTLYANDHSFSERIDPYLRCNLGGYIAEAPRKKFKGVQETNGNCRSDWLQRRQMGPIREPEGLPPYIPQAPPTPLSGDRFYFPKGVQEPLKDFQPFSMQRMPVSLTQEAEVLPPLKDFQPLSLQRMPVSLTREAEVLPPLKDFHPLSLQRMPVRVTWETKVLPPLKEVQPLCLQTIPWTLNWDAEVLPPYQKMLGRGGY